MDVHRELDAGYLLDLNMPQLFFLEWLSLFGMAQGSHQIVKMSFQPTP